MLHVFFQVVVINYFLQLGHRFVSTITMFDFISHE
jgi:hypothetical protein